MDTTDDEQKSILGRLRGSWKVLAVLLLVTVLTGAAVGQTTLTFYDDFEGYATDGTTPSGWTNGEVVENGHTQFQSLRIPGQTNTEWTDGGELHSRSFLVSGLSNANGGRADLRVTEDVDNEVFIDVDTDGSATHAIQLIRDVNGATQTDSSGSTNDFYDGWFRWEIEANETHVMAKAWNVSQPEPQSYQVIVDQPATGNFTAGKFQARTSTGQVVHIDWVGSTGADARLTGTVRNENSQTLSGVTITANQSGSTVNSGTTGPNGEYQIGLDNGTYNVTASKPGYFNQTREVTIAGDTVQDFTLVNRSQGLNLQVRPFVEHGQTVPYTVTASITNQTTGEEERIEVTDDTVVISSNPGVVSVNGFNHEVTGTSDTSINQRVTLTAEYDHPDLEQTLTDRQNVTVANATVSNLKILPPVTRFTGVLGGGTDSNPNDKTIMVLLVAVGAGVVASRWASSFAGVAGVAIIMEMGWILGFVSDGVAIVTVFIGMFIGLNVAGNVDYQVNRR